MSNVRAILISPSRKISIHLIFIFIFPQRASR